MLNGWQMLRRLWKEEEGLGTVEIIFIIAVILVIVLIFKNEIITFIKSIMKKATTESNKLFES